MDGIEAYRILLALAADAALDALAIMMTLRVLDARIRPLRVGFAAIFASVTALAVRLVRLPALQTALLWLPLAACMMRLAGYSRRGFRADMRGVLTLLACEGFLGGVTLALLGATGSLAAAYALCGACAAAVFVAALRASRSAQDIRRVHVECMVAGRLLRFDAVVDSGNSLRDYLTHRPVIVAGEAMARQLAGLRMRPIFADTAGGRQMMRLVMPEETALCLGEQRICVQAALAFSPGLGRGAPALVPASLLRISENG